MKYTMKAQLKLANASALLEQRLAYHFAEDSHTNGILDCNHKLVFRLLNVLNRDVEQSAPQVISYVPHGVGGYIQVSLLCSTVLDIILPKASTHIPRVAGQRTVHALGINNYFNW